MKVELHFAPKAPVLIDCSQDVKLTAVGITCQCGQSSSGVPGSTVSCLGCGAVYLVSAMRLA